MSRVGGFSLREVMTDGDGSGGRHLGLICCCDCRLGRVLAFEAPVVGNIRGVG